ncbi:hypothetical protein T440DRAFT_61243 [Plenodomus tracheiphilus IPT5]|uniref:Uncharacterized protein n=1 Tax=Plenodomus tracheiphilus IPT5 TaxID=1408161 RepID=A0A6A7B7P7_9PLEO|nr:hypothetical protein T440DRAFT_61243 [Plenodomus tracheiphilus IPT5]
MHRTWAIPLGTFPTASLSPVFRQLMLDLCKLCLISASLSLDFSQSLMRPDKIASYKWTSASYCSTFANTRWSFSEPLARLLPASYYEITGNCGTSPGLTRHNGLYLVWQS